MLQQECRVARPDQLVRNPVVEPPDPVRLVILAGHVQNAFVPGFPDIRPQEHGRAGDEMGHGIGPGRISEIIGQEIRFLIRLVVVRMGDHPVPALEGGIGAQHRLPFCPVHDREGMVILRNGKGAVGGTIGCDSGKPSSLGIIDHREIVDRPLILIPRFGRMAPIRVDVIIIHVHHGPWRRIIYLGRCDRHFEPQFPEYLPLAVPVAPVGGFERFKHLQFLLRGGLVQFLLGRPGGLPFRRIPCLNFVISTDDGILVVRLHKRHRRIIDPGQAGIGVDMGKELPRQFDLFLLDILVKTVPVFEGTADHQIDIQIDTMLFELILKVIEFFLLHRIDRTPGAVVYEKSLLMDQTETVVRQIEKMKTDQIDPEVGKAFSHPFGLLVRDRETGSADNIDPIETDPAGVIDKVLSFDAGEAMFPSRSIKKRREIRRPTRHIIGNYEGEKPFFGRDDTDSGLLLCRAKEGHGDQRRCKKTYLFHIKRNNGAEKPSRDYLTQTSSVWTAPFASVQVIR